MQRQAPLSQFSQHVCIIRIVLLRPLVARIGTKFSRLLCLPVLHGTSNCCRNSPRSAPRVFLATSCHASPATFVSCRSGSTMGLNCPAWVCRWLRGLLCSRRHHCRFFQDSIALPPCSARAMCPYMSHMRSSVYVLHLSKLCGWPVLLRAACVRSSPPSSPPVGALGASFCGPVPSACCWPP